ncbi:DUF2806 domain-containing protein [Candidatus Methylospira mobilis]|uniref:DUF2806 domain-containing protein n=1 Tax=Candidatus Methylospira mobilis TaxID=1808979 RepID=A0A5Q0BDJ5_9GAMM|nr:DUF2806 domain-containing protein [Candidatus Methylospira mobilis]QFY41953.1 DUF2806 domain-containing protein [Candidatus Methylospira mobilis]WNV02943.1 DUF2806 domain-containing protein [Candidatus Methylospira mobilis]
MSDYQKIFNDVLSNKPFFDGLTPWDDAKVSELEARAATRADKLAGLRQQNLERILGLAQQVAVPGEINKMAPHSDGWLAQFLSFAQDVTDERAQQFWADILAHYIADPDSIFKRSLFQLHQMDMWELEAFIEYCAFSFSLESGWRFMFEEALTRQELWGYVQGNDYTQHFINVGLLSGDISTLHARSARGMRIRYAEKEYALQFSASAQTEFTAAGGEDAAVPAQAAFGYRKFTPAGQQLARAVRSKTFYGYARNLIKALDSERGVVFQLIESEAAS